MTNLDLYARIEPMIGFYDAYEKLYEVYLQILEAYAPENILDVGCGNGNLLHKLSFQYQALGIDISPEMVEIACAKGLNAKHCYLHDVEGQYDAVLAVADVLNYLSKKELQKFLEDVAQHLSKGGIFVCDVNTLHGFEDVASGSMIVDEEDKFLAIDALFEEQKLYTDITFFEKTAQNCYTKESATIVQNYHSLSEIISLSPIKMIKNFDISLFSMESDKTILVFQK
jgi:cyclopropane fatty-acyl-phospholipid synthase-like methyltransferase